MEKNCEHQPTESIFSPKPKLSQPIVVDNGCEGGRIRVQDQHRRGMGGTAAERRYFWWKSRPVNWLFPSQQARSGYPYSRISLSNSLRI